MSHFSNIILASSTNVFPIESDLSGNTLSQTRQIGLFGIFKELLSTHNVNVARFARNVECDFFCDFQPLCEAEKHMQCQRLLSSCWCEGLFHKTKIGGPSNIKKISKLYCPRGKMKVTIKWRSKGEWNSRGFEFFVSTSFSL